ncbi:S1 family peptidase [Sciscionella marina]|uniref:S1 family peptidase n=1 Tax=Sciscionella marina TaxID=508770 RepID=UPI000362BF6E|nr:trypsin-like serine protease [Sciscionella marina]
MRKSSKVGGLAAATLGLALVAAPFAQASPATPKIIGGEPASDVSYGAQVYVDGQFNCSGSVIAPEWVLTAQHCDGQGLSVKVGSLKLGEGEDAKVEQSTKAPGGDLLLLHLDHAVKAQPVQLGDKDPAKGDQNKIYGWGREEGSGPPAPALKVATVEVTGQSQDAFDGPAIASKGVDGASWHGDSGGPQIADGKQVGVCSTGENSGSDKNGTQNYASVANSRDWIKQTAGV